MIKSTVFYNSVMDYILFSYGINQRVLTLQNSYKDLVLVSGMVVFSVDLKIAIGVIKIS